MPTRTSGTTIRSLRVIGAASLRALRLLPFLVPDWYHEKQQIQDHTWCRAQDRSTSRREQRVPEPLIVLLSLLGRFPLRVLRSLGHGGAADSAAQCSERSGQQESGEHQGEEVL